ncbi:serine/threonine-protein kinase [Actinomadura kijaniata]|uniref:serine/threonine-protein kinase n=1 Tax=Actinomadura kijaniata TaxID=46161 RepID=UPI000A56B1C6|nr:serine/threonine-protein kinase [Actinomadura kijaniata]
MTGKTVIDGRFELRDRLGSGGMGTVWRAFDLALQREVALKEVRLAEVDMARLDPEVARMMRERVMREARALARIDHPNVVTIHHIVDSPDTPHPWLVMELVRGRSLQERLSAGPMSPAEGAALGRGVLAALRAAHEAGICHRDVKPANVLLRADGTPALTDFGIAVLEDASRVTATGGLVGSPEYIAPERLHGEEGNPASDLWSLGMLMYVAVEGAHPLRRPTTAATLAAVMTAPIPPARRADTLAPVLQALLVREPGARPSAAQLDAMLASVAGGTPTSVPPPPPPSFPAPGTPSGPMPVPVPGHGTGPGFAPNPTHPAQGRPRRSRVPGAAITILALGLVATLVTAVAVVLPRVLDAAARRTPPGAAGTTDRPGLRATGDSGRAGGKGVPESRTLLEPATIRGIIKRFQEASGSKQFAQMTVHQTHASADAPAVGRPDRFDNYTYQKGAEAAVRSRPSIAITEKAKVDFGAFNWEALPQLMKRAERTLNVKNPTSRYIIAKASWTFAGDKPVMMLYLSDEYGGGYLATNAQGKIISTQPAD